MPLLLADFIYSRDCKLNLRKNVDTTQTFNRAFKKYTGYTPNEYRAKP